MKITYEIQFLDTGLTKYFTLKGDPAKRFLTKVRSGRIQLFTENRLCLIKRIEL